MNPHDDDFAASLRRATADVPGSGLDLHDVLVSARSKARRTRAVRSVAGVAALAVVGAGAWTLPPLFDGGGTPTPMHGSPGRDDDRRPGLDEDAIAAEREAAAQAAAEAERLLAAEAERRAAEDAAGTAPADPSVPPSPRACSDPADIDVVFTAPHGGDFFTFAIVEVDEEGGVLVLPFRSLGRSHTFEPDILASVARNPLQLGLSQRVEEAVQSAARAPGGPLHDLPSGRLLLEIDGEHGLVPDGKAPGTYLLRAAGLQQRVGGDATCVGHDGAVETRTFRWATFWTLDAAAPDVSLDACLPGVPTAELRDAEAGRALEIVDRWCPGATGVAGRLQRMHDARPSDEEVQRAVESLRREQEAREQRALERLAELERARERRQN